MSNKGTTSVKTIPQNSTYTLKSELRGPKSGPRAVLPGDTAKFEDGYDRIYNKPPVCPLCSGLAEVGTCAVCDGE